MIPKQYTDDGVILWDGKTFSLAWIIANCRCETCGGTLVERLGDPPHLTCKCAPHPPNIMTADRVNMIRACEVIVAEALPEPDRSRAMEWLRRVRGYVKQEPMTLGEVNALLHPEPIEI